MSVERPPLVFIKRLGGLFPANAESAAALTGIDGKCVAKLSQMTRNQRRRSLYWVVVGIVAGVLNDAGGTDFTEGELHDEVRRRLGYVTYMPTPGGGKIERLHSTSDRAMNEADRAIFTTKAFEQYARWTGVPVETLIAEGRTQEGMAA